MKHAPAARPAVRPSARHLLLSGLLMVGSVAAAHAQTTVKDAWVRGTVPQQKATGAFMEITSAQGGTLASVSSPAAGVVEIHEMAMDGNMMRMRALPQGLPLPAGKPVTLKAGGYHVMLMDLKAPLKDGDTVPLSLVVKGKDGKQETIELKAPVKALGAKAPMKPEPDSAASQHKH